MNLYGLSKEHFNLLNDLAVTPLKKAKCKVWIFGSRASNTYQKFSDIDLLYEASEELKLNFIYKIKTELEESNLPVKVDLVNVKTLAESYQADVLRSRIQIA